MKKTRNTSVAKMKKKAWAMFSRYVRLLHALGDVNECYTCEGIFPIKNLQAGHGIGGRNNAVLFMEEVVRPQCRGCNIFAHGRYAVFTRKLIDELGMERYDELVKESNKSVKYTLADYTAIYEKYKKLVDEIDYEGY